MPLSSQGKLLLSYSEYVHHDDEWKLGWSVTLNTSISYEPYRQSVACDYSAGRSIRYY